MTMFAEEGGWPFGEVKDNDPEIHEKQKRIQEPNPVRNVSQLCSLPRHGSSFVFLTPILAEYSCHGTGQSTQCQYLQRSCSYDL